MQDKLQRFRQQFNEETRERIAAVNNMALSLERDPARKELVEQLKREMHTIKGGSRILGLKSVSHLAHYFEEFFMQVTSGSKSTPKHLSDRLFKALDLMQELLELDDSAGTFSRVEEFLKHFEEPAHTAEKAQAPGAQPEKEDPKQKLKRLMQDRLKSRLGGRKDQPPAPVEDQPPPHNTGSVAQGAEPPQPAPAPDEPPRQEAVAQPDDAETQHGDDTPPAGKPDQPGLAGGPPPAREEKKPGFSRSFRIESDLIDTVSEGALQLKVMTSFFDMFQREYSRFVDSVKHVQREAADLVGSAEAGPARDRLESVHIQLRDLARTNSEKRKFIESRITAYQHYFNSFYNSLESLKLIPLATIFSVYPRFVRDYASRNEKEIEFNFQGGAVRLDKRIAEAINESLIHLLRNAVDHGIETAAERAKSGKPPAGHIQLAAATRGDRVVISVTDDGRGFDPDNIRESALRKRLISEAEAGRMSRDEAIQLVFIPGFSTAPIITDTSGRGVGMDVVLHAVNNYGGTIRLDSEPGRGATVRLTLPISISTTRILHVRDQSEVWALPADFIREVKKVNLSDLTRRGSIYYRLENGHALPAAQLSSIIGSGRAPDKSAQDSKILLVLDVEKDRFGLLVDQTLDEENVIVHRKDPFIQGIPYISGLSVNIFGEPFLVVDGFAIPKYFQSPERPVSISAPHPSPATQTRKTVLLVEDSVVTREMEKVIIESAGYQVVEAVNGLDGIEKLGANQVDCIVTDVEMPVLDGFSMTERIRGMSQHREIPIIVVTTRENRDDKIRGIQVGANAYITKKDFDQMKLVETIKRLI